MTANTTHFKVDNGDMLLIETATGRKILTDINIRCDADDPDGEDADVATQLRDRLERDALGRLYVDAMLLTHPDQDHIRGYEKHFHTGPPSEWKKSDDKILVREMWSSPIVFRRANQTDNKLCEDASAWASEARRRVKVFREARACFDGDRVKILGEDVNGKTDDILEIVETVGTKFQTICGVTDITFRAHLLAPLTAEDEDDDVLLGKNNASVVMNVSLGERNLNSPCQYLLGGDSEVVVWDRIWELYKAEAGALNYDVLAAPHHCSWRSLSHDSWSKKGEDAQVSKPARNALSQAYDGARVVASSKQIKDDDSDPPCIRAKREYDDIVEAANGSFTCLADLSGDEPLKFEITDGGVVEKARKGSRSMKSPAIVGAAGAATQSSSALGGQPFKHG